MPKVKPHRLRCPCALAGSAIGLLAAGTALAQSADEASQTVVVTGSVAAQRVLDAPFAITSVDAQALRDGGPMINLSESLARVPGLQVANRNNYAQDLQISSRGFGARAGFGVRGLRMYTDGIPATMPDGQGQVAHFDLAGASRIEVLRGPFSVLYGHASGGVIALFGAPAARPLGEIDVDAGSFGLRQARATVASPLAGGFDIRANVSKMELDGFRPQSAAERTLGNVRLGWQAGRESVTVLVSDHQQQAQDPLGLTRAQFELGPDQVASVATQFNTRKTIRQSQAGVNWRHSFGGDGWLREGSIAAYTGSRGVTQWLAIPPGTQGNPRHGGGVIDFDRAYDGVEARTSLRAGPVAALLGVSQDRLKDERRGFENFTGSGASQLLGVVGALRRDELNRADTREGFAQAEVELIPGVAATLGLRSGRVAMNVTDRYLSNGDDSGALRFSYTNPVLGVRWKASGDLTLHASAARGFESPTLGELAYRADGSPGFNSGLEGQTSRQFELGAKWRTAAVDVDAAVFNIRTDNEIGVQTNAGGRSAFQNVGRTERHGIELSGVWRVTPALRAQASAAALHAAYRDGFLTCNAIPCNAPTVPAAAGNRIAGTQGYTGWGELAWKPGMVPGEFALEWRGQSRTPVNDLNSDYSRGFGLVNLRWSASWPLGEAGELQSMIRVDNAADRAYAGSVIVNDANGRFFEPGAPRNGLLSLRWVKRW